MLAIAYDTHKHTHVAMRSINGTQTVRAFSDTAILQSVGNDSMVQAIMERAKNVPNQFHMVPVERSKTHAKRIYTRMVL